ncbi:bifunctional riboflavin kinase/FAD synthetase [Sediminibacterium roseum]|uniref:Riboflavin biosynthesis protein n=1 Tax=Sediminibacterium roseum TaxID=1978412 RepID=A0ABW9ZVG9_9BACT|nr:bifunctional riboflavin kinase/FAD synthetase [Sediminibacterium roseum]NCI51167.1 bifunctional riboflavin kinase/FAD synthetase [Sediminibacterium roseum]
MKVHRELAGSLPEFKQAVVTIGTFDGVHLGHRQILSQLKEEAARIGGETVIITFHPHPRKIISSVPGDIKLLNTLPEKIALLEKEGIDHLVVVPFDHVFANQTAEEYVKDFLYRYFRPHTVIIGYDHRFGKGREGDYHLMKTYGENLGFEVKEISEQLINEIVISSTKIRRALMENEVDTANEFLGYPYFFEGTVIEGNKLGRTIGYPTANLHVASEEKLIPGDGVYAVTCTTRPPGGMQSVAYKGMMNIGLRPTVDGKKRVIEVNIFDFDKDIYGQTLQVHLHSHLRGEVKFNGLDALKAQLEKDKSLATEKLARH